ncbi:MULTISPECIES: DUF7673 family protein [Pseudomonas]|uniref:DUF7673 family protein n=1 Tax=Pseudomonas TaxID=286 RepID=UPI001EEA9A5A|nr:MULTISPECIES: hypothetical protein [Pseudomonas]MCK2112460.1 hypothetical protein [Pseudomonas juntendi]MCK2116966.1 hypothetical protein [Pseudomonas juntendi]MDG9808468.1 hypothetical protein [Pseudomonas juntendi]
MDHSNIPQPCLVASPSNSMTSTEKQEAWKRKLMDYEQQRVATEAVGLPALQRLVEVANQDSGQSQVCGRFLLALYNGKAFPFELSELRRLERSIWEDCMAVLALDQRPKKEIHLLVKNGPAIWDKLKFTWAPKKPA